MGDGRAPPGLAGAAADPNDPYGVAELFRQCLRQAAAYRGQRERSADRLVQMTVAMAGALVLLLAAAASMVLADVLHPPPSDLQARIENLRRNDPSEPADRLRGSPERLQADLDEWTRLRDAPDFGNLPSDLQSYVDGRIAELTAYIPWLAKLEETTARATPRRKRNCEASRRTWPRCSRRDRAGRPPTPAFSTATCRRSAGACPGDRGPAKVVQPRL